MTSRRVACLLLAVTVVLLAGRPVAAASSTIRDGAAAFSRGRLAHAERMFARATVERPNDPQAWLWLGVVRFHLKDAGGAEQALARAARLAPRDALILVWWGHLLARLNRGDDAVAVLQRSLMARGGARTHRLAEQALRALRPLPVIAQSGPPAPGWVTDIESYQVIAQYYNPRLLDAQADRIAQALLAYSRQFNLDPRLVVALVVIESGFQPTARSRAGAIGLGQLMPGTARALGVNPWDPVQNLYGSIRYLRGNLDRFGWDRPHLALAAYNAGRGAVERYEGIPPYAETQWYVANVTSLYRRLLAVSVEMPELHKRLAGN